jgi:two-component system, response regulator YesN
LKVIRNLLTKLLISYILVLLFPIIIILVYFYPFSTGVVKEKEMEWNDHVTEQYMNAMDIFTRYVYNLPTELLQNREIKMYMAEESEYQKIVIANEMRKYNATDAFVENTLLYVKSIGYLFAKTGSAYAVQDFANPGVGYYYEEWPQKQMFDELDDLLLPTVRPVETVIVPGGNRMRVLTFLLPLPVGGEKSPASVMIMVKEDTIIRMMRSVSEAYSGDFYIFDREGRQLLASNSAEYGQTDDFAHLITGLGDGRISPGIHGIGDHQYIVSHAMSDRNGWQYVSLLPVTETLQDIRTLQRNTILLLVFIVLLEILVIFISIRKNYHPIKRLVELAKDVFVPSEPQTMNEIDTIRYALNQLSTANNELDDQVKRSLPIMRDKLLLELVSGRYSSWQDFQSNDAAQSFKLKYPYLAVAVIACAHVEDGEKAADYGRQLEGRMPEGIEGYFFKSIYQQEIIFVCTLQTGFPLKSYMADVHSGLAESEGIQSLIGISKIDPLHTPEGVHHAYLQAVRTLEYLRIRKPCDILVFDEIQLPQVGAVSYFAELLQSLELSILKNDAVVIESVMERMIDYIRSDGMPPHMVRSTYLNTISVILNGLQRFRQDDQNLLHLTDAAYQQRYTLEEMAGIMKESCGKLCDMMRNMLPPAQTVSQEEIIAVIETHGMDANFSQQLIADHFGMSVSNFSYHFKRTMGQNFKEYIDRLRIQKSIQLLRSTDQPLDSISSQVGYANTSSYIRSFKKIVGTTPGQYRDSHR